MKHTEKQKSIQLVLFSPWKDGVERGQTSMEKVARTSKAETTVEPWKQNEFEVWSHTNLCLYHSCVLVRETVGLNLYNGNNYPFGMLLCDNKLKMMMSRKHVSYCIAVSLLSYHLL